jgi:hypothetical protein
VLSARNSFRPYQSKKNKETAMVTEHYNYAPPDSSTTKPVPPSRTIRHYGDLQVIEHVNGDSMTYEILPDEFDHPVATCKNGIEPCSVRLLLGWHKSLRAQFGSEFGRDKINRRTERAECVCDGKHGADLNCVARRVCASAGIVPRNDMVGIFPRPEGTSAFEAAIACALTHLNHTNLTWLLSDPTLPVEFATVINGDAWPLALRLAQVYGSLRRQGISIDGVKAGLNDEVMVSLLTHDSTLMPALANLVGLYFFDTYKISGHGNQMSEDLETAVSSARKTYNGPLYLKRGKEYIGSYAPALGFQFPERLNWVFSTLVACGTLPCTLLWACEGSDAFEACGDDIGFFIESRLTAWPKIKVTEELVQDAVGRFGENGAERGIAALLATDYTILHHAQEVLKARQDTAGGEPGQDEDLPFSAARAFFFELVENGFYQYMIDDMRLNDKSISYDGMMMCSLGHRFEDWGAELGNGESLQSTLGLLRASYDASPGLCICEHLERVWVLMVTWIDHLLENEPLLRITSTVVAGVLWVYTNARHPAFDWERVGRNHACCGRPKNLQSRRLPESRGVVADMRDLRRIYTERDESAMKEPLMKHITDFSEIRTECKDCQFPDRLVKWFRNPGNVQEKEAMEMQHELGVHSVHLSTCQTTPHHIRRRLCVRMFCRYMCSPAMYFVSLGSLVASKSGGW